MTYTENMSLDEIIELNKKNRPRRVYGTNGENVRGRGGLSGRVTRGGGAVTRRRGSRAGSNKRLSRSRSRSRMSRNRSWSRGFSRSQTRSKSRQRSFSYRSSRSASRSRFNGNSLTSEGKIEFGNDTFDIPTSVRSNCCNWGIEPKPIAIHKQGISKRGHGISNRNRYSTEGLRSDEIHQEHRQTYLLQNIEKKIVTQSRNSFNNSVPLITISVGNDFSKKQGNSVGTASNLNKQTLKQHNNDFGGFNTGSGPGRVRLTESNMSNSSNSNRKFNQSRGRGRGRGRVDRGIGKNFVNRQILNPKLQNEIAAIQSKSSNFSFDVCIDNIS